MKILTTLQAQILNNFAKIPDHDSFCFTGGTALSHYFLKHRKSHDLDFFTSIEEIIAPFSQKLEKNLKQHYLKTERLRGFNSFVELSVHSEHESTIIHLALDSPFRFEPPFESAEIPGLKIDSLLDIASNKMLALFSRATLRDFIDVFFLVKKYFNKELLIEKASQKDTGFDLYWLAVAFERINDYRNDSPDLHLLARPCPFNKLKDFFNAWQKEIILKIQIKSD